jgi:hypothetical protein
LAIWISFVIEGSQARIKCGWLSPPRDSRISSAAVCKLNVRDDDVAVGIGTGMYGGYYVDRDYSLPSHLQFKFSDLSVGLFNPHIEFSDLRLFCA